MIFFGNSQAKISGNKDLATGGAQQRSCWKAGGGQLLVPCYRLPGIIGEFKQPARTAQPQVPVRIRNDAVPSLLGKSVLAVEIGDFAGIYTAKAGIAPEPNSSARIQRYAMGR